RRRVQVKTTVRRALQPVATLADLGVVLSSAERHTFSDVGFATDVPGHVVVDLAIANGHRATADHAARMAGGDLQALVLAVAAPRPPEVERHAATVDSLLALHVVLATEPGQR